MQVVRVRLVNGEKSEGCEKTPVEMIKALREIGSNENKKVIDVNKLNLEEIHVDLINQAEANHLIFENSKEIFYKNEKVFFIGGDQSMSYSISKAFKEVETNPLLIVFDAHVDCLEPTENPRNVDWLRKLIDDGFNSSRIVVISARNFIMEELEFLEENKITLIGMDVLEENIEEICDLVMERAKESSGFHISIDIDSVDPSFAPGTGRLEPGGLSSRDLIYFVKRLSLLSNFRGADITEINPDKDINGMTVKLGAKLLAEMI